MRFVFSRFIDLIILTCFTVSFPVGAQDLKALAPHFNTQTPDGDGPFPVMILLPGCSGFKHERFIAHYKGVEARLNRIGFMTVRGDVLSATNNTDCKGVYSGDVAPGVLEMVEHLKTQPNVRPDEISLMGWSYGSSVVLQVIKDSVDVKLKHAIAYYPGCSFASLWNTTANVLLLYGDKDKTTPPEGCRILFDESSHGSKSAYKVFPNAHHIFDFANLKDDGLFEWRGDTMGYNEGAYKASWKIVERLLAQ